MLSTVLSAYLFARRSCKLTVPVVLGVFAASTAFAAPDISEYAVPESVHTLTATARTVQADQGILSKIGKGYGDAYKLKEATYIYTAPNKLEYKTKVGPLTGYLTSETTTTTTKQTLVVPALGAHYVNNYTGSDGLTKRKTIFDLGVLPKNYLEIVRAQYVGEQTAWDTNCQVFVLRYVTDAPNYDRRFEIWIDPAKHYIVQKKVWAGNGSEHETIVYRDPRQILPSFWLPSKAQAYTKDGELGGTVEYENVSGS